jgi:ABC-type branched-subunit amino acid transport system ATPase component
MAQLVSDGYGAAAGGAPPRQEPILELRGVVAGYGGGDVLRGVSLSVDHGGITCIVGPNGAGKSTVLAAVSGILRPRRGDIRFKGESLIGLSPRAILERGIVQVPQEHSLFRDMTVRENIEMGAFIIRDRALVRKRLEEVMDLFPLARERSGSKAGSLSGGQQRIIEFARSLMLDPALVVLDEPSMGLDPKALRVVFETVRTVHRQGRTILLVEQNARAGLRLSTQGVVLESGLVRLVGAGQEVLENPEIGALYLGGASAPRGPNEALEAT